MARGARRRLPPVDRRRQTRIRRRQAPHRSRAFPRAAEGIRTLDLLHGKQNVQCRFRTKTPANCGLLDSQRRLRFPAVHREITGFGHRMGTRGAYSALARGRPRRLCTMRGLTRLFSVLQFRGLGRVPPDARWHGHSGARRAGARRRTAKTGRWLRPIRLGIGASNCAMRSAPSSNSCAAPSRSCARNSIRRTRRSEVADSAIRMQARHSRSSPKPGPGAAVAFERRCENVTCSRSQRTRHGGARSATRRVGLSGQMLR
jgi:hypothetical protein